MKARARLLGASAIIPVNRQTFKQRRSVALAEWQSLASSTKVPVGETLPNKDELAIA